METKWRSTSAPTRANHQRQGTGSLSILIAACVAALLVGCSGAKKLVLEPAVAPDYSDLSAWAAHPEKEDLSDKTYTGISNYTGLEVPVFFAYPTVYFPKNGMTWNADVQSPEVQKAVQTPLGYQASVFNVAGPVYMPYYRQAAYDVYDVKPNSDTRSAYELAYRDIERAFDAFLREIGPGNPFILAAHSQGTDHLERLLNSRTDVDWKNRLVAAYLIGMPVDKSTLPVPPCELPDQTACVISWRTFKEGAKVYTKVPLENLVLTNPLSWTIAPEKSDRSSNSGALLNTDKPLRNEAASARLENGVVYTDRLKFPGSRLIMTKNYHRGDINLYYQSIQENLLIRLQAWSREFRH